jgi:hypothetical protein
MTRKTLIISLLIALIFALTACKTNKHNDETQDILNEWINKEIKFPDNLSYTIASCDSSSFEFFNSDYKILLYSDSAGCTSCNLKLNHWQYLINDAKRELGDKLDFLFYIQAKSKEELDTILISNNFEYPVFYDINDTLNKMNHFPQKAEYRCFLLDKHNRVAIVGNPVLNNKIWELQKHYIAENSRITDKDNINKTPLTSIEINKITHNFGNISTDSTYTVDFIIKNIGDKALIINNVIASCGCTSPQWEKNPIKQNESTTIKIHYTPDKKGFFDKQIFIFCNIKQNTIRIGISGIVN